MTYLEELEGKKSNPKRIKKEIKSEREEEITQDVIQKKESTQIINGKYEIPEKIIRTMGVL